MAFAGIEKWMGKVEDALLPRRTNDASIRKRGEAALAGHDVVCELSCVCAVTDRPYILQYEQGANGKLRLQKSTKGDATTEQRRGGDSVFRTASWPVESFETPAFSCPWCGSNGVILCGACETLVCKGRTVGKVFHCRGKCGAYGIPEALPSIKGAARRSAPPANAIIKSPASGTGTALVKK